MTTPTLLARAKDDEERYHGAKNSTYTSASRRVKGGHQSRFARADNFIEIGRREFNHIACRSTVKKRQYASDKGGNIYQRESHDLKCRIA